MNSKELWKEVDRILWEDWDPIGVNDYGGPDDEYRGYVSSIIRLLEDGADESTIAKLLHEHANGHMGLLTEIEDHIAVAKQLKHLSIN